MRSFSRGVIDLFTADGTAIANTTTETSLFGTGSGTPIGGKFMHQTRLLHARYFGKASCTGTPTLTFRLYFGNGLSGTMIALTEALAMGSGVTNANWLIDAMIQARADGTTGKILVSGEASLHTAAGTVLKNIFSISGWDAPAEVTVDLMTGGTFTPSVQWSAADALNTLTPMHGMVEAVN